MSSSTYYNNSNTWELPADSYRGGDSKSQARLGGGEAPAGAEEDPLADAPAAAPVFFDEPNDGSVDEEADALVNRQQKNKFRHPTTATTSSGSGSRKWLLVLFGSLFVLILVIPIIILTVDRKQSEKKLKSNPDSFEFHSVQVDISQPVPVVGIEVSVLESALPKFTHLDPNKLECQLFPEQGEDWGNTLVASIQELTSTSTTATTVLEKGKRKFYIEATLTAPPSDDGDDDLLLQEITEMYATMSWLVLIGKTNFISSYSCYLHMETKIGNMFAWDHVEDMQGKINLPTSTHTTTTQAPPPPQLKQQTGNGIVGSSGNRYNTPTSTSNTESLGWMVEETSTMVEEEDQQMVPTTSTGSSSGSNNQTYTEAATVTDYNDDTTTTTSLVVYNPNQQDTNTVAKTSAFISIHEISRDGVILKIRIPKLPQGVHDVVPYIRIKLPSITLQVQPSSTTNAQTIHLQPMTLQFSESSPSDQYALANVGCASSSTSAPSDQSCPWYNPSVNLMSDTFRMNGGSGHTVIEFDITAGENSFLEQMVGPTHHIVLYRIQMEHQHGNHIASNRRQRHLQGNSGLKVDCIRAQDMLFGDVFAMSLCMNLVYNEGIALDGYLNFYGYGGKMAGEMAWQEMDNGVLRLDGSATVDLLLEGGNNDETKMDLLGSAVLDMDQLTVAVRANNTGPWMPFRFIGEANVEYQDPEDTVVLKLTNLTLEANNNQYVHATGDITLDNMNSKISMVIIDPRLDVAMDAALVEDGVQSTYKILYDTNNIMTGDTTLTVPPECVSDPTTIIANADVSSLYSDISSSAGAAGDDDSLIGQVSGLTGQVGGAVTGLFNPCGVTGGNNDAIKLESKSSGKFTTSLMAGITSDDNQGSIKVTEAKYQWDGEQLADATMSMIADSLSGSTTFSFVEKVQDHRITSKYEIPAGDANPYDVSSEAAIRLYGEDISSSKLKLKTVTSPPPGTMIALDIEEAHYKFYDVWIFNCKGSVEIKEPDEDGKYEGSLNLNGESFDQTFALTVEGDLASTPEALFESNMGIDLMVDNALVWSEKGLFVLTVPVNSNDYQGTLQMEPNKDKEPRVKMNMEVTGGWKENEQTFSCELPKMILTDSEELVTDSTGKMELDIQKQTILLNAKDEYKEDSNGYTVDVSARLSDTMLTGTAKEIKIVHEGEPTRDASGNMELNFEQLTMSYAFADTVVDTLLAMNRGGIEVGVNPISEELQTFDIVLDGMNVIMRGDPYVHGGSMNFGITVTEPARVSFSINNNETSRFPLDIDWSLDIGSEETNMQASIVYSPPPKPVEDSAPDDDTTRVIVNSTILVYNLEGLKAAALTNPDNAETLEKAFDAFVEDLLLRLETSSATTSVAKGLGTRSRRRLAVTLLADTAKILRVVDVDCPADAPDNASCQHIDTAYTLEVIDENPAVVRERYVRETDKAIEEGKFADSLKEADKEFPVVVMGPVKKDSNAGADISVMTSAPTSTAGFSPGIYVAWISTIWAAAYLLL